MVKELLEIILPVISFYNPQLGLYTTNGNSRPTYVFITTNRPNGSNT